VATWLGLVESSEWPAISASETGHTCRRLLFPDPPVFGGLWACFEWQLVDSFLRKVLGASVFAFVYMGPLALWSTCLDCFVVCLDRVSVCLADQSRMCQSACSSLSHGSAGGLDLQLVRRVEVG
jgi:hypothetical protein